jgi:spore maturation protein CgeB
MKILYIGDLTPGATSKMRLRALQDLGHCVTTHDDLGPSRPYENSVLYRAVRKFSGPWDFAGANAAILSNLERAEFDVLWLDKALTVKRRTLEAVKRLRPRCKIIGFSLDDMYAAHNHSRRFLNHLPLYDLFITTKSYGVGELKSLGCRQVEFIDNAFDVYTHRPIELTAEDHRKYDCNVGFVGTFEQERADLMAYLGENDISVQIIGDDWHRWTNPHQSVNVRHGAVWGDEYAKAICASKISLCFLRKINRDLQTTRSIEIPACGAFMLAERTDEHLALFEESKEAEFFSSKGELLEKVRYYLAHPDYREQIAAAGRERCLRAGYSYHDRLRKILQQLEGDKIAKTVLA